MEDEDKEYQDKEDEDKKDNVNEDKMADEPRIKLTTLEINIGWCVDIVIKYHLDLK